MDADVEVWNFMLAINLVAPAMLIRVAARNMVERGVSGRIVNVSSSSGFRALAPPCYASSKAGIAGLTRSTACELGRHDINVNCVAPGLTATAMTEGREFAIDDAVKSGPLANLVGRASTPEDVASAILYLCRPESRQITGQVIHTSAGLVV
jgi:NAD(P)-dependent dehydrogenase (short-subunit alcohol dehydrogenase family)